MEHLCSEEEHLQHSLASERRRLRLYNDEAFSSLLRDYQILQRSNLDLRGSNGSFSWIAAIIYESLQFYIILSDTSPLSRPRGGHGGGTGGGGIRERKEEAIGQARIVCVCE